MVWFGLRTSFKAPTLESTDLRLQWVEKSAKKVPELPSGRIAPHLSSSLSAFLPTLRAYRQCVVYSLFIYQPVWSPRRCESSIFVSYERVGVYEGRKEEGIGGKRMKKTGGISGMQEEGISGKCGELVWSKGGGINLKREELVEGRKEGRRNWWKVVEENVRNHWGGSEGGGEWVVVKEGEKINEGWLGFTLRRQTSKYS